MGTTEPRIINLLVVDDSYVKIGDMNYCINGAIMKTKDITNVLNALVDEIFHNEEDNMYVKAQIYKIALLGILERGR